MWYDGDELSPVSTRKTRGFRYSAGTRFIISDQSQRRVSRQSLSQSYQREIDVPITLTRHFVSKEPQREELVVTGLPDQGRKRASQIMTGEPNDSRPRIKPVDEL